MRSDVRKSLCPSRFCRAPNPAQALISTHEANVVGEQAIAGAIRCGACGSVYVRDERGRGHILGTLRRAGSRWEWKSDYRI
jgi:hypothetical protein